MYQFQRDFTIPHRRMLLIEIVSRLVSTVYLYVPIIIENNRQIILVFCVVGNPITRGDTWLPIIDNKWWYRIAERRQPSWLISGNAATLLRAANKKEKRRWQKKRGQREKSKAIGCVALGIKANQSALLTLWYVLWRLDSNSRREPLLFHLLSLRPLTMPRLFYCHHYYYIIVVSRLYYCVGCQFRFLLLNQYSQFFGLVSFLSIYFVPRWPLFVCFFVRLLLFFFVFFIIIGSLVTSHY